MGNEKGINMKKINVKLAALMTAVMVSLISCAGNDAEVSPNNAIPNGNTVIVESKQSIRLLTSIEEAAAKAEYIVICTVTDIGDTYLDGDPELPDTDVDTLANSKKVFEYVNSIRTPVTLQIEKIFYDSTGELGDTLTLTEKGGTYQGYTLKTDFLNYEVGSHYLMFISIAPDGITNISCQGSAELVLPEAGNFNMADTITASSEAISFSPMIPTAVFDSFDNFADVVTSVENVSAAKAAEENLNS